jgi:uncharacterized protein (TIGR03435 family)
MRVVACAGVMVVFQLSVAVFQAAGQPSQSRPHFEVASVRPHVDTGGRGGANVAGMSSTPGRINIQATTALDLIAFAFGITGDRIEGWPRWLNVDSYDVIATTPSPASLEEQKLMLQTLLAERFGLVARRASKEGPVYVLVSGKKPSLTNAKDSGDFEVAHFSQRPVPHQDGSFNFVYSGKHASMSDLAVWLSAQVGRPVLDETGIKGLFDIEISGPPLENTQGTVVGGAAQFIPAIRDQLGLVLESRRGMVETLVIDHIQKPSEN